MKGNMDGNNEAGDRETVKKVSVLSISLSHTIQTHAALFDLQPGLFLISLRLLNLRLAAAGKDSYRLSPMRSSCVSLSLLSLLSHHPCSSKTVGSFLDVDILATPGLFEYLSSCFPGTELAKSLADALERTGVTKGKRKTKGESISAKNHVLEELCEDVTEELWKRYKRTKPSVRSLM